MSNTLPNQLKLLVLTVTLALSGCGQSLSTLMGASKGLPAKVPCPGDHSGFFVCMSDSSSISDQALAKTISTALAGLATLVNSEKFNQQISSGLEGGADIDKVLGSTNYTVTVQGYCDTSSEVLGQAMVGGNSVQYNECNVSKDSNGNPDLAEVSGVLLHEISHNLGYTHPDVNPSRTTVPYYLGDTATSDLGGSESAGTASVGSNGNASGGVFGGTVGGQGSNAPHPRGRNTWRD